MIFGNNELKKRLTHLEAELKLITGSHRSLQDKVDGHDKNLSSLAMSMSRIDSQTHHVNTRVTQLESEHEGIHEALSEISEEVSGKFTETYADFVKNGGKLTVFLDDNYSENIPEDPMLVTPEFFRDYDKAHKASEMLDVENEAILQMIWDTKRDELYWDGKQSRYFTSRAKASLLLAEAEEYFRSEALKHREMYAQCSEALKSLL